MKKMTKGLAVLTVAILMFAFAGQAGAFCVHNMSDRQMWVTQTENASGWKPFAATLYPTDKACCNWQTDDCNKSGGQTDSVAFEVFDTRSYVYICINFRIPANGDLYIYKENNSSYCRSTPPPMPVPPPQPVIK